MTDQTKYTAFDKLSSEKQSAILQSGIREFAQKSYIDASTDSITRNAGISKGLLFHYFGSKKEFYLYCIAKSLDRLIAKTPEPECNDFYEIIFSTMDEKVRLCNDFPDEMHLINLASRETAGDVIESKNTLLQKYLVETTAESTRLMTRAVATLPLKEPNNQKVREALQLYIGIIMNKYLASYNLNPDAFFKDIDHIKAEIKQYIDFMLYGILKNP